MRVAWLDLSAGVAGDMLLAALVDAGADLAAVQGMVERVLPEAVHLSVTVVQRAGLRALKLDVRSVAEEHPHRAWREIRDRLAAADLPAAVARPAGAVFGRLAEVEGRIHGVAVDDVEFHEVGAWDSVADVVGTCAALHLLGVDEVVASVLTLGSGTVRTAHGELPVPVPAVLGLVDGWTVRAGGAGELATPTGVALVTTLASRQGDLPDLTVSASGVGAGTRDPAERANVVRVVIGESRYVTTDPAPMTVLEANVDDLDPRVWPSVLSALLDGGAADAWLVPIVMKKGRPAHTLSVLCSPGAAPALRDLVLGLTTSLGVRQTTVERYALERGWIPVTVDGRDVAVKVSLRDGVIVHATPEFEDVAAVASERGRPVREILTRAIAAAEAAGLTPGADVPVLSRRPALQEPGGGPDGGAIP